MDEKRTTRLIAQLIGLLHSRPRQALNQLSTVEAEQALAEIAKLPASPAPRYATARSASKAIQYSGPRHVATTQVDDDVLAKMAGADDPRDVNAALAKIHAKPQRCVLPQLGSKANQAALRKRLEQEN
jgi:hypothetical protein